MLEITQVLRWKFFNDKNSQGDFSHGAMSMKKLEIYASDDFIIALVFII